MALRPPSTPRASSSNIPAPGSTPSSLPTPRRKSGISLTQRPPALQPLGSNEMDSLRQAVRRNDPTRYDSPVTDGTAVGGADSPSPAEMLGVSTPGGPRPTRKPSSVSVRPGGLGASSSPPTTPSQASLTAPRTPSHPPRSRTPTAFGSSVSGRPSSRLGMSRGPSSRSLEVGDAVTFEVAGFPMEGTIRFLGEVDGKDGEWGGVELDPEWEGQGKNDGSVKGTQYFACAPLCGLFLPLSKITPKPREAVPFPGTPIASKITAGSRASKYLGVTAAQLATNRRASLGPPSSPSKSTATPRRAAAERPPSASIQTTPRPRARASMGGAGFGIPTPRKSLGPGTPRQSLGASIKRPPSSLRQNTLPDVPRIPDTYSLARSVTPASSNGRATPSTPSGAGRRMSLATETSLGQSLSRPTTPSVRSYSRQSFASSVSRQSHRSLLDDEGAEDLHRTVRESKEREDEIRQLLEGSERVGREMEDKLAEKERRLKEAEARVEALEQERNREKERELARMAGIGEEDKEQDARRILELETKVDDLLKTEATLRSTAERLAREWDTKFAAKEGENESLRERMAAAATAAESERSDLHQQLDQLRGAGQALCETYEERIAEIEHHRLEAVDLAESLQEQLLKSNRAVDVAPGSPDSPSSRLSSSHNSRTSAADVINAESAQAELEHLQSKMESLEEQLEETRMQLEAEVADSKKRRTKHSEMEQTLKKEIKSLRETIDRSTKADARSAARIQELEQALLESQTTLEEERSELEGLRVDASGGASAGLAEEIKRANKQIASLTTERQAAIKEAEEARLDSQTNSALVQELESELDRLRLAQAGSQSRSGSLRPASPPQLPTQDTSPNSLQPSPSRKRDSIASNSSKRSIGVKDEATVTKEQILGLKVIIKGLEEENAEMLERNKSLLAETQALKEAHRALESKVDNLSDSPKDADASSSADASLRREVDELKTQLKEAEKRSEREIKALNQEIQDMESLVENKIYREDELETELEKYKKLAARQESAPARTAAASRDDDGECEMCGEAGHQLDDCPVFAGSAGSPIKPRHDSPTPASRRAPASSAMSASVSEPWCDNCDEYGHTLAQCSHAEDDAF